MKAKEHPQYSQETLHLKTVIAGIESYLERHKVIKGSGADNRSAHAVYLNQLELVRRAEDARQHLYFGRLDLAENGSADRYYLGRFPFLDFDTGTQIFAWQDTELGAIYYGLKQDSSLGRLMLKRLFDIAKDQLLTISDEFVAADQLKELAQEDKSEESQYADSLLLQLLRESRSGQLSDIVRTIQAKQYEIISAPADQTLIVEGPPGSGKTQVALHRVSYLLYHARARSKAGLKVLVLGPNRLFMNYVAAVLPTLGEQHIPQQAMDEWMVDAIGANIRYVPQHTTLEILLDPAILADKKTVHAQNARNKGSLQMAVLLERYVDHLYAEHIASRRDLVVQLAVSAVQVDIRLPDGHSRIIKIPMTIVDSDPVPVETIRKDLEAVGDLPFNQRGPAAEKRVLAGQSLTQVSDSLLKRAQESALQYFDDELEKIREELEHTFERALPRATQQQSVQALLKQIREARTAVAERVRAQEPSRITRVIEEQVHEYFEDWMTYQPISAYRQLLATPTLLQRVGKGVFTPGELDWICREAREDGPRFSFSDLAALVYLKILLVGDDSLQLYDHIVVDEAQDVTPLQARLLATRSRNQALTVLGDPRQAIYTPHQSQEWTALAEATGTDQHSIVSIDTSYRSTRQIFDYANSMLARVGIPPSELVNSFAREGQPVQERHASSRRDLLNQMVSMLNVARTQKHSVAIVCKTAAACRVLAQGLSRAGFSDHHLVESTEETVGQDIVIIPVALTKGLEFDQVILADADAKTYPADDLHMHLLYVALTRPAHYLQVCWVGQISPLLDKHKNHVRLDVTFKSNWQPHLTTIEEYARKNSALETDRYVVELASQGCLHLLADGQLDTNVLDSLFMRGKAN